MPVDIKQQVIWKAKDIIKLNPTEEMHFPY